MPTTNQLVTKKEKINFRIIHDNRGFSCEYLTPYNKWEKITININYKNIKAIFNDIKTAKDFLIQMKKNMKEFNNEFFEARTVFEI